MEFHRFSLFHFFFAWLSDAGLRCALIIKYTEWHRKEKLVNSLKLNFNNLLILRRPAKASLLLGKFAVGSSFSQLPFYSYCRRAAARTLMRLGKSQEFSLPMFFSHIACIFILKFQARPEQQHNLQRKCEKFTKEMEIKFLFFAIKFSPQLTARMKFSRVCSLEN